MTVKTTSMLGLVLICLGSCSQQKPPVSVHDFGVVTTHATNKASTTPKQLINVGAPTWLWDNRIRYRLLYQIPSQVRFYGLDHWIATPPELFEHFLITNPVSFDYTLLIQLQNFEQQFESPQQARVVLNFSVDAYRPDQKQTVASKNFALTLTSSPDAQGAIQGFKTLAQQAAEQLHQWCNQLAH